MPTSPNPQSVTGGRFDTSQFNKIPASATDIPTVSSSILEIEELQRGIRWLDREIGNLEIFARFVSGQPKLRVLAGPISCTDGRDRIFLQPQRIKEGQDPGPQHMAHLYHELAHALESQVFEPRNSRKPEDSLKYKAVERYGAPADHVWNGLEDGRVEERLYKTMPGARKHLVVDVTEAGPNIVIDIKRTAKVLALTHLMGSVDKNDPLVAPLRARAEALKARVVTASNLTPDEQRLLETDLQSLNIDTEKMLWAEGDAVKAHQIEEQVTNDMGLLMASYLYPAGYDAQARAFGDGVVAALDDPTMQSIMNSVHGLDSSLTVLSETTPAFMKRAKELGFFLDFDPRGFNPYTKEPQVIDWNKLTPDEQEALREQIRQQNQRQKQPGEDETIIINAPKDLIQPQPQPNSPGAEDGEDPPADSQPGEGQEQGGESEGGSGDESEGSDPGSDSSDDSSEPGSRSTAPDGSRGFDSSSGDTPAGAAPDDGFGDSEFDDSDEEDLEVSAGSNARSSNEPSELEGEAEGVAGSNSSPVPLDDSGLDPEDGYAETDDDSRPAGDADASGQASIEDGERHDYESAPGKPAEDESLEEFDDAEEDDAPSELQDGAATAESRPDKGLSDEEIDQQARELHERNEESRVERVKDFSEKYGHIEDMIRPPHVEYATENQAKELEKYDSNAQKVKQAMNMEVGEISGAPESKFLFKQNDIQVANAGLAPSLEEYSDVIAGEVNRLRAIFKANEKSSFAGRYEIGSHINSASLPGLVMGEHLKPFDRRIKPKKVSYAVTLMVDQSGSMNNDKIRIARVALCLQAHLLDQLGVPFEILGFSTTRAQGSLYWDNANYAVQHDVFKSFSEPWNSEQRAKVLAIKCYDTNLDGLALAWAWNRLKVRRENVKIMMTYTDGQPNPDTDNQIRIMKHVLRQMQIAGAIGIGVGIQSYATQALYQKAIYCDDIRTLPRLVTKALEEELRKKRS